MSEPEGQPLSTSGDNQKTEMFTTTMTTISVERLNELLRIESIYNALVAHGVDNWTGYDDAMAEV